MVLYSSCFPLLNGEVRRSYVLWQEYIFPLIVLEFVSGNGTEERDKTPPTISDFQEHKKLGKFWVYKRGIRIPFDGIYKFKKAAV